MNSKGVLASPSGTNFIIDGGQNTPALKDHSSFNFTWRFINKNGLQ